MKEELSRLRTAGFPKPKNLGELSLLVQLANKLGGSGDAHQNLEALIFAAIGKLEDPDDREILAVWFGLDADTAGKGTTERNKAAWQRAKHLERVRNTYQLSSFVSHFWDKRKIDLEKALRSVEQSKSTEPEPTDDEGDHSIVVHPDERKPIDLPAAESTALPEHLTPPEPAPSTCQKSLASDNATPTAKRGPFHPGPLEASPFTDDPLDLDEPPRTLNRDPWFAHLIHLTERFLYSRFRGRIFFLVFLLLPFAAASFIFGQTIAHLIGPGSDPTSRAVSLPEPKKIPVVVRGRGTEYLQARGSAGTQAFIARSALAWAARDDAIIKIRLYPQSVDCRSPYPDTPGIGFEIAIKTAPDKLDTLQVGRPLREFIGYWIAIGARGNASSLVGGGVPSIDGIGDHELVELTRIDTSIGGFIRGQIDTESRSATGKKSQYLSGTFAAEWCRQTIE